MNYIPLETLKNAWVFNHNSLPIEPSDKALIKAMSKERSAVLWDTFISKQVDHPDFFKKGDWPFQNDVWTEQAKWEPQWDSENPELPALITDHLNWDQNTVIYYCCSRTQIFETTWLVFKRHWKNFLFMDDGTILIGKKRKEVVQFLSNGQCKIGNKPV